MRRTVLSVSLCFALLAGVNGAPAIPFHHPAIEARYSGGGGDGNVVQNSNDAEMGQLSGIFNALVNELQTAPKLANGPQAEAQRQADQAHRDEITPDNMEKDNTTPNPAVTDAPPEDAPPETKMIRPVSNNQNRFGENVNFNNFQAPPPQFNPQFGGGPFNGPYQGGPGPFNGPQSMYTPPGPSPYAMPFQPQGPFGQGPYGQGPYDNGPYQNQNYPPPPQKPIGNPGSYGADNSALQESGMGQLGQFFSSMVSELQNSGFNNNVESAIAPKKPVKKALVPRPPAATTTTTTTQKTTTTPDDSSDS